jgi:ATP-binding cassette, subfamily C, bacterial LapB
MAQDATIGTKPGAPNASARPGPAVAAGVPGIVSVPLSLPDATTQRAREQALPSDALLDALVALCRLHGTTATRESLAAGLPLEADGMTVALAERAATRAGLTTRLYKVKLQAMERAALPAILMLRERGACVLLSIDAHGTAKVLLPQAGMAAITMKREELESRYTGVAFFARPKFAYDARTEQVRPHRSGHWFWRAILSQRLVYRDVLWAAALINLFAIALPMYTMNVYDRVVPNNAIETMWALSIGALVVISADVFMRILRARFVDEASARIDLQLSSRLMEKVLNLRLEHKPASVGAFAATLRGFEQVRDFIASSTVTALIDLPFGLLFVALVVWISPWLALPVVAAFAITVALGWVLQARLHVLSESTHRASAQRNATLIESLAGLETLKVQGAEGSVQAKWERANEHLARIGVQMRSLSSTAMVGTQWLAQTVNVLVVVIGVYLIAERQLTMGALIAVSMLSARALAPAAQIVGLLMQYQGARTALTALDKLMASPVERPEDNTQAAPFVSRGALQGSITFRNVSFSYPGRTEAALNNVSFHIEPGEIVALIGRAGSGKSTIQKLVLGLYQPTSGSIAMDGVDIRQIDPAELRRNVASLGQDSLLFYGSLRDNVALGQAHADDADVFAAAQAAGLAAFVNRHPQGMHMPVGERGEQLSGGQRQAVALARAYLHGGPILCLDEPTSAMDHVSEAFVQQRLTVHARGRTVLLATHRRTMLPLATRLIVMDEGKVVADGPRDTVLAALEPKPVVVPSMPAKATR